MQTYNPNGTTQQGQQQQSLNEMQLAIAQNPNNAILTPEQQVQASQDAVTAGQQVAGMQTPEARGQVIQNSDIPAMQTNYEDMARQLFQYDKVKLNPVYGTSPGQAPDALSAGRVGPSELFQLTPGNAGIDTLFADNPKYGISSQTTAGTNIVSLLSSLNDAIQKEFVSKRGKYASDVKAQQSIFDNAIKLLTLSEDQKTKLAGEAEKPENVRQQIIADAKAGKTLRELLANYRDKGGITADQIYQFYNDNSKWKQAKETPEELAALGIKVDKTASTGGQDKKSFENSLATMAEFLKARKNTSALDRLSPDLLGQTLNSQNSAIYEGLKSSLLLEVAERLKGNPSDKDMAILKRMIEAGTFSGNAAVLAQAKSVYKQNARKAGFSEEEANKMIDEAFKGIGEEQVDTSAKNPLTGTNQSKRDLLKAKGYSDEKINEYFAKGGK